MHEICQIAFEAHHAACKQSSGSKLGHTPQSKTIRDEEAFFLLKIIGMKEKNTEAYSAKNEPGKRRVRVFPGAMTRIYCHTTFIVTKNLEGVSGPT